LIFLFNIISSGSSQPASSDARQVQPGNKKPFHPNEDERVRLPRYHLNSLLLSQQCARCLDGLSKIP